ncbi:MAG: phosphatase PAP2 family protein [Muribaculaceae bacterium]|nr:phosphatase PAP2 family protein [Muribaculaceae bacterium]
MLEYLQTLDTQWLLAINGMHSDYMDSFMWMLSKTYSWALIVLVVLGVGLKQGRRHGLMLVLAIALAVLCADQLSSGLIKNAVERLRPTHEPSLEGLVHLVRDYRGGMYGFVSSHAANSFAVAVLVGGMFRHKAALGALLAWACVQCYSRMYLGVHYPGDILGGAVVGIVSGVAVYQLWRYMARRWMGADTLTYSDRASLAIAAAVCLSVALLAIVAAF